MTITDRGHADQDAVLPWKQIVRESDALTRQLADHGPSEEILDDARLLLEQARRSGQLTPQLPWRGRLEAILEYWAASLRMLTNELVLAPALDAPAPEALRLSALASADALRSATSTEGIWRREVCDWRVAGAVGAPELVRNLIVKASRLIAADWENVRVAGDAVLSLTSMFGCRLVDVKAHALRADNVSIWGSHLHLDVGGTLDFTDVAFRRTRLEHCCGREIIFNDADLGAFPRPELEVLAEAYELMPVAGSEAGVVFVDCTFDRAAFKQTNLRDARFIRCSFRESAVFDGAIMTNASFEECAFGAEGDGVVGDFLSATDVDTVSFDDSSRHRVRLPATFLGAH